MMLNRVGDEVLLPSGTMIAVLGPDGNVLALFEYGDHASRWKNENYKDRSDIKVVAVIVSGGT